MAVVWSRGYEPVKYASDEELRRRSQHTYRVYRAPGYIVTVTGPKEAEIGKPINDVLLEIQHAGNWLAVILTLKNGAMKPFAGMPDNAVETIREWIAAVPTLKSDIDDIVKEMAEPEWSDEPNTKKDIFNLREARRAQHEDEKAAVVDAERRKIISDEMKTAKTVKPAATKSVKKSAPRVAPHDVQSTKTLA